MTFDIAAHLGAITREVRDREIEGKPGKVIIASRVYDTTPADLWDALTQPDRISRWFAPISGELKLGGRYAVKDNASGTITACEPQKRVELTWEFGGYTSWVNFSISPADGGTLLELEHIAHVSPHWTQFGAGAVGVGWELGFLGLAAHLKRPADDVRAEGVNNWETSPEAKELVRQASAGWGKAEIAAGEAPEQAHRAAEATRRFFSGEPPLET
ncbi:SRPBCC family protein [Devosia sp. XK-2]|uniref:SRPBCC family protein n=1 Tax=Devosia sp. XK-2 TaxID=3126689 RepID=UPI0030D5463E